MEGEVFVDPEEDEVFFAQVATQAQLEAVKNRRSRKTMVFNAKVGNKENVSSNIVKSATPFKKNTAYRNVPHDSFDDLEDQEESIHNTTPCDPDDNKSTDAIIERLVDVSLSEFSASQQVRRKTKILDWPSENTDVKVLTPARQPGLDFEDIETLEDDNDLDSLFKDCQINESMVSWASVDVNTQLESLMANMDNLLNDENDESDDPELVYYSSSTPRKSRKSPDLLATPKKNLEADTDGGYLSALSEAAAAVSGPVSREQIVPALIFTKPTPDQEEKYETPLATSRAKLRRPLKLVYRDVDEKTTSSSSSGSFGTPFQSTPFLKPTAINIPKSSGAKPKMTPGSKIPTCPKNSASKSLQFTHIESPITKYIHQKSTPLVRNIKPRKKSASREETPKKMGPAPKYNDLPVLPAARYQKGVPLKQEKVVDSKLPRLGPVQLNKIKPLSPRVVKHNSREFDVSVLVSAEAKLSKLTNH